MFNAINFAFPSETNQLPYPANTTVESAVIAVFLCPSDGQQRVDPINWGGTNYVSNSGTGTINNGNFNIVAGAALPDGPFYNTSAIRFAAITDGLSNTAGYSETIMGNNITTSPGSSPPSDCEEAICPVQYIGNPLDVPVVLLPAAKHIDSPVRHP